MKIKSLLVLLVAASIEGKSAVPAKELRLRLEGDGHACSGYLRTTAGRVRWKSSFSLCDSAYRVAERREDGWVLELVGRPGPSSRACHFGVVSVRRMQPEVEYPLWEVVGFASESDRTAAPPKPVLACNMQSASARH